MQPEVEQPSQQRSTALVDRFFSALKAIYGSKFDAQFASVKEVQHAKGMWRVDIEALSEAELKACLAGCKRELKAGEKDFQWPNIGRILGLADSEPSSWEHARIEHADARHRRDQLALPSKPLERDAALAQLAKLKASIAA